MRKKVIAVVLSAALVVGLNPWMNYYPSNQVFAEEPDVVEEFEDSEDDVDLTKLHRQEIIDEAIELGVSNAFIRHNFAEDYEGEKLGALDTALTEAEQENAPKIKIGVVESSAEVEGLVLTKVDTGVLARTKIDLGEFDFGELKVGRVVYNMLADKKSKGTAYLYFKDSEEPFASIVIKRTANEDWEKTTNCTVDLRGSGLAGKGHIYMKFVADSALDDGGNIIPITNIKGSLFLESMFFTEGSTPVVEFDLDKEINTIENINGSELHTTMGYGNMNLEIPDGYVSEYTDEVLKDTSYELDYIRGRGNSTWLQSKKPYKIKLDKSADLFGMGSSKHWVLLANYFDYSLVRNKLTFYLADKLGMKYTPKSVCVDVVISGVYCGSYQLSQHVRVGKNNIAIDDLEDEPATAEPEITGGYLLSMGTSWLSEDPDNIPFVEANGYSFRIEKPEYDDNYPEEAKDAQLQYLETYLTELGLLVDSLDPDITEEDEGDDEANVEEDDNIGEPEENEDVITIPEGKTWRDYMDEQSFIDYYLLQEFSKNGDAYSSSSTYLYKERNGLLYWGPVWDFDFVAWGAYSTNFVGEGNLEKFEMMGLTPWFNTLIRNDKDFKQKVIERWKVLSEILTSAAADDGILDQYKNNLYYSALANYQVNGSYLIDGVDYWSEGTIEMIDDEGNPYTLNYSNEIERLKKYITEGASWINDNIDTIDEYEGETNSIYPPVPFYIDNELAAEVPFDFAEGVLNKDVIPIAPAKDGFIFKGWYYTDDEGIERKFAEKDIPYGWDFETMEPYAYRMDAKYIPESEYAEIKDIVPVSNTIYVPLYLTEELYEEGDQDDQEYDVAIVDVSQFVSVIPFNADPDDICYYTEDEEYSDGNIWVNDIGEITITCKANDAECTITIIAYDGDDTEEQESEFSIEDSIKLKVGEYGNVNFSFIPSENQSYEKYYDILFAAADPDIIEVNENGAVLAKKAGITKVITMQKNGKELISKYTDVIVTDENGAIPQEDMQKDPDKVDAQEKDVENTAASDGGSKQTASTQNSSGTGKQTASTENLSDTGKQAVITENSTEKGKQTVQAESEEPSKAVIKKVYYKKKVSDKLKIKLAKSSNANGYEIAVYDSTKSAKANKKAIAKKNTAKLNVSIKSNKFKDKKKLYIKVRAYNKKGNTITFGKWSKIKVVKAK